MSLASMIAKTNKQASKEMEIFRKPVPGMVWRRKEESWMLVGSFLCLQVSAQMVAFHDPSFSDPSV